MSPVPPFCLLSANLAMLVTLNQGTDVFIHKKNPIYVIFLSVSELWGKGR